MVSEIFAFQVRSARCSHIRPDLVGDERDNATTGSHKVRFGDDDIRAPWDDDLAGRI